MDMDASPLEPRPVSSRPYWTDPVAREETLAVGEKFRKVGWRQPNYKASTTKIVAGQECLGQIGDSWQSPPHGLY
jgi:hypothetical protein